MCVYLRYASTMARFVTYSCLLAILVCIVFVTALCSVAWHVTYLFFDSWWRCCCLCVLFLHPAPLWSPLFVVLPACYGAVVLPMQVRLQCMVSYLRYVSTVARFVTYLLSPCLHPTVLCLLCRYITLRGI